MYILSDDMEFNSSGIGNITGIKYLRNYDLYKETLIGGLEHSRSRFLNIFTTWNHEVFPQSSRISDDIPEPACSSCSSENIGGIIDTNNVASILEQLSFELNEEEEGNISASEWQDFNSDNRPDVFYAPESPIIVSESSPSSSNVMEPVTTTMAIPSPIPKTQLMDDVQHDQSSKAPPTGKKTSWALVQKGQS